MKHSAKVIDPKNEEKVIPSNSEANAQWAVCSFMHLDTSQKCSLLFLCEPSGEALSTQIYLKIIKTNSAMVREPPRKTFCQNSYVNSLLTIKGN